MVSQKESMRCFYSLFIRCFLYWVGDIPVCAFTYFPKYERLGKEYTDFVPPNDDRVRLFVDRIEGQGIQVEIKQV